MPFQKGVVSNPNGRPRKPEIEQLREALEKAKRDNGDVSFLEHYCGLAYKDRSVAVALANKILPDLSKAEVKNVLSGGIRFIRPSGEQVIIGGDKAE